jgi:hypothetical protein
MHHLILRRNKPAHLASVGNAVVKLTSVVKYRN